MRAILSSDSAMRRTNIGHCGNQSKIRGTWHANPNYNTSDRHAAPAKLGRTLDRALQRGPVARPHRPFRQRPSALFRSYILIVDVVGGHHRFRFRLLGTSLADAAGRELTGKYFDEADISGYEPDVLDDYDEVLRRRGPL
jgi:hypothetical protein